MHTPNLRRVVVVDDDDDVRLLLDVALEVTEGVEVVGRFPDAPSAIDGVATLQPDIVVLDLSMPGMSGLDALPQLLARAPGTRVIVYSASDHPDVAAAALAAGAAAYLAKAKTPINDVVAAVRTLPGPPLTPPRGSG